MKKLILFLLLIPILCSAVSAGDRVTTQWDWEDQTYLYDMGDVLSDHEEMQINSRLGELSESAATELLVFTVDQYGTADEDQTATYCHQYSLTGNAVVLVLAFSEYGNSYYFAAYGEAWDVFNDRAYDKVEDAFVPDLRNGDYAEGLLAYGEACAEVITSHGKLPAGGIVLCILIGGLLSFLIPMNILKGQLKTVRSQPAAASYIKTGSMEVTHSRDTFLYRNVSRVAKPQNNSSGGSRGGGGGGGGRGGSF